MGQFNTPHWWYRGASDPGPVERVDDVLSSYPNDLLASGVSTAKDPVYGSLLASSTFPPEQLDQLPERVLASASPDGFEGNSSCMVGFHAGTGEELKGTSRTQRFASYSEYRHEIPEGEYLLEVAVSCR